jgi:hypothetical protein
LFKFTYAELPEELVKQMRTMRTDSIGEEPGQIGLTPPIERVPAQKERV